MGDLDITPRTRGKIAQTDYDFWLTQSEDTCLYCLSPRQIAILLTALPMSEWRTRWFSPTGVEPDMDLIQAEIAKIETELMTNHCDLETAINNINTNITNINSNITTINANLTIVENNVTTINKTVINITQQNTYNNLTINIPNVTFTLDTRDTYTSAMYARYNGFCLSMEAFILSALYRVAEAQSASPTDLATIQTQAALLSVGIIVGLLQKTPGIALTNAQIVAAASNITAIDHVACAMISKLSNLVPTAANFNAAFLSYTPPAYPADEYVVWYCTNLYLQLLDGFSAWNSINQYYFEQALAANPTDYNCPPCNPPSICSFPQTWDLNALQLAPWTVNRGILSTTNGLQGVQIAGDTNYAFDISLYFPTPCFTIIGRHWEMTLRHLPTGAGNSFTQEIWYLNAGVPTRLTQSNIGGTTWPAVAAYDLGAIPTPPGGNGIYRLRFYQNSGYYGNATQSASTAAELTKIRIF